MKTAVEWFANRISHGGLVSKKQFDELLEQAKEMHKEQIINARHDGRQELRDLGPNYKNDNQYYNETYKK
jgi:uncharacterized protein (DUF2235 family)